MDRERKYKPGIKAARMQARRQEILDTIQTELVSHQAGETEHISGNKMLARQFGVSPTTIFHYLKELDPALKEYRHGQLMTQNGVRVAQLGYTPFRIWTAEQRANHNRERKPGVPPRDNSEEARQRRSEAAKKRVAKYGLLQHSKGEKRTLGEIGRLTLNGKPTTAEQKVIGYFKDKGLFVDNADEAVVGQIYFSDLAHNKWAIRLEDGKIKVPDFAVAGTDKVIEVYGGTRFHSERYCRKVNAPDYQWDPSRMLQEYAKVGIDCFVITSADLEMKNESELLVRLNDWLSN